MTSPVTRHQTTSHCHPSHEPVPSLSGNWRQQLRVALTVWRCCETDTSSSSNSRQTAAAAAVSKQRMRMRIGRLVPVSTDDCWPSLSRRRMRLQFQLMTGAVVMYPSYIYVCGQCVLHWLWLLYYSLLHYTMTSISLIRPVHLWHHTAHLIIYKNETQTLGLSSSLC